MAVGLNSAFVLQTTGSRLYRMRDRIQRGLGIEGPALFCAYSGCGAHTAELAPYLAAAVALESRAFPAFTYDPTAGRDWSTRFDVSDNPQPAADWPVHRLDYEDCEQQRVSERIEFTFADFAACDRRYAGRVKRVPPEKTPNDLLGVAEHLQRAVTPEKDSLACIFLVDDSNRLERFIIDEALVEATRRCADIWHSLQELGGINNSHARALLERERSAWQREQEELRIRPEVAIPEAESQAPGVADEAIAAESAPSTASPPPTPGADEPYIETLRCTSCDECVERNSRMFVYDENKQARIADPDLGTYQELVEAAESCQVAIIHPGAPRNPDEPNLEVLIARGAAFN
jgi:ferredoxin